jgi:rubrerythrin
MEVKLMTDLDALLNEAMNKELEAKKFYTNAADKAQSKAGKKLFSELANFEQNHYEKVKGIIESRIKNNDIKGYNQIQEISKVKSEIEGEFEPNKDEIVTVINLAINAEIKAQEIYNKIADLMTDMESKKIFQNLAQDERNHQKILEDEFYHLSNKGTIIWE